MSSTYERLTAQQSAMPGKGGLGRSWYLTVAFTLAALTGQPFLSPSPATPSPRQTLQSCLGDVCSGRDDCVRFAGDGFDDWARPFNLARSSIPAAIVRPTTAQELASVVKCAATHNVKVQAKAGGHSFGNYGLGGQDGAISVDLEHFQYVSVDDLDTSGSVRVGGGTRLGELDARLRPYHRAVPHGVCPGIGIGGHATVGGLGPMSRMWGTTLDHVEEVEVVTANGTVLRASNRENPELFFALRGAGAGFGIVTEFLMRTRPAPRDVFLYEKTLPFNMDQISDALYEWQKLVADPELDQHFGTQFTVTSAGARISAAWYGTDEQLRQSMISERLSFGDDDDTGVFRRESWDNALAKQAAEESLHIPDVPSKFLYKSHGLTREDTFTREQISALFEWIEAQKHEHSAWSLRFEAAGGAVEEVPLTASAYAHRDKFMFYQLYAAQSSAQDTIARIFAEDFHRKLLNLLGERRGTYPGFVDPELKDAQAAYWGSNLPALEHVKTVWDPMDVFHNPQSVRSRTL